MAFTLKRKRDKESASSTEKKRQVIPESGENINDGTDGEASEETEEEWGGIVDYEQATAQESSGSKPKKPPTGEELRTIKDATDLFRSNSFKLQIDALLPNVRPKYSRIPPLERALFSLHAFITSLPDIPPQHPLEAARALLQRGIAVPYSLPLPTEDTNWKVAFEKPNEVTVVGSWANKLSVKAKDGGNFCVDLAVEMPETLLQEKDYLNGRFFHKRAFYLATIAAAIASPQSGQHFEVAYESHSCNSRLNNLILYPRKDASASDFTKLNAQIRIIPTLSPSSPIPLHRLSPSHSNIRITTDSSPTPLYNTTLLLSLTPKPHLLATHALKEAVPAFCDALTLLRVWANQRGYGEGTKMCVRGFEDRGSWWVGVLSFLVAGEEQNPDFPRVKQWKPVGKGLSSYQLFRAALDFISRHDFTHPVYLKSRDGHRFQPEEYSKHYDAVFVDASSTLNLLSGVPLSSLDMLRYDAEETLDILDHSSAGDPFAEIFLQEQRDLPTRFDTLMHVDISSAKFRNSTIHTTLDYGSASNALLASLASLLRQGLGNRTKAIAILHPTPRTRPVAQTQPSHPTTIRIGLIHDPDHAFRLVDQGSAADDPDEAVTERFRDFWGDKAELRRFKDGRIVESVVWEVKTSDERAQVPAMVVQHILARHLGVDAMHISQTSFEGILNLPDSITQMYQEAGVPIGFKSALSAFDQFVKAFKTLDDELPLSILSVSPASPYLRYTSVFVPVPRPPNSSRYFPLMEIILEFEKSARWPDDLCAIQKIKLAFFERIAAVLMASIPGTIATVVLGDSNAPDLQDKACLDIITTHGWAFRARIWHDREATLLDRIISPPPIHQQKQTYTVKTRLDALAAREVYVQRFIHAPRHHRAIAALCHRSSAFAGTVRLVQRWLAAHWLLHTHVRPEALELLCAHVSLGGTKERGFAAVVRFLANWDWRDGVFVQLYEDASNETKAAVKTKAEKQGVWKLATAIDAEGQMWTAQGPDVTAAQRVRALAVATWAYLQGMEHGALDVKTMFVHPTDDYDFVVQLDKTVLPRYYQNVHADASAWGRKGKYANLQESKNEEPSRPGYDPAASLFADLQHTYADTLKIFWDPLGGDRFGAIWDPSLRSPRPFRVLGGFSSMPVQKEGKAKDKMAVKLNESAVLSEIERMGLGLIKEIAVHV